MNSSSQAVFFVVTLFSCLHSFSSQQPPNDNPTAKVSTSWINSASASGSVIFRYNSTVRPILLWGTSGPKYACGFYCNGNCETYLFAVFIVLTNPRGGINPYELPQVVWSANRNNPVRINSSLQLTAEGELVLRDADGTRAWSTNTAGRSVAGLNLTEMGNLVLFDINNSVVWQSFDHPTDCLVPGQILVAGKNLTASASSTNWTEEGLFTLSMTDRGLVASIPSNPPQVYYERLPIPMKQNKEASYAKFQNGSPELYLSSVEPSIPDLTLGIPPAASAQYMKFGPDGHLRVFEWGGPWRELYDVLTGVYGDCGYPMVCGKHGICSNGECSCPRSSTEWNSFRPINDRHPDLGCSEIVPLTCNASNNHGFLDLENVTYFAMIFDIMNTDVRSCRQACLKNCSCKAATFLYRSDASRGEYRSLQLRRPLH